MPPVYVDSKPAIASKVARQIQAFEHLADLIFFPFRINPAPDRFGADSPV